MQPSLGATPHLELFLSIRISKETHMNTNFIESLPVALDGSAQVWIIGTRDQVVLMMNELYVKRIATDRVQFTPIIPAPFATGKYMTVLVR